MSDDCAQYDRSDVLVLGGGLAGISTALACADAGLTVTLLESRGVLGGRTASFRRDGPAGSLQVDTGQHVFLRCCVAYLALLRRLGVDDRVYLQPRLDVPVLTEGARRPVRITRGRAPAPLHLGPALASYRLLSPLRRLKLARAALALRRVDATDPATDQHSFGDWLTAHGQDAETIAGLWDLITVATLNAPARESSLALAATVFQIGLLRDAAAGDLGWPAIPLGALHGDAGRAALSAAGVSVRTGAKITALDAGPDGWRLTGSGTAVGRLVARQVVLAVPAAAAERLLPRDALTWAPGWSDGLSSSPIVNVHVIYDRPVTSEPFLAAVGSPVQWVFDRTASSGLAGTAAGANGAQYLAVSLSAARELIGVPTRQLLAELLPALGRLLPEAARAQVLDAFVTRESAATFAPSPGTAGRRPGSRTRLPGLYLAGSWTATGWPDTMESAVRSGDSAAEAVTADHRSAARRTTDPSTTQVPA